MNLYFGETRDACSRRSNVIVTENCHMFDKLR